jgi:GTP-binding protein
VIDAAGSEGRKPLNDFLAIKNEMDAYSPLLAEKPQIIALNKIDLVMGLEDNAEAGDNAAAALIELTSHLETEGIDYYRICAATGQGVPELMNAAVGRLALAEKDEAAAGMPAWSDQSRWMRVTRTEDDPDYRDVKISVAEDGAFVLEGKQLFKIFDSTQMKDHGSLSYLNKYLVSNRIVRRLKERGLEEGGTIRIKGFDMEWYDDE